MKTKYQKKKQTDTSAPLTILAMSISLALLPNRGRSATSAGQAWVSGMIPTSQNHNTRSAYMDVPIFLAQKNTKMSRFLFYPLYTDTVPLSQITEMYPQIIITLRYAKFQTFNFKHEPYKFFTIRNIMVYYGGLLW